MRNTNLYWAQSLKTPYGKENAISPIFTTMAEYKKWKKENKHLEGRNCIEEHDEKYGNRL